MINLMEFRKKTEEDLRKEFKSIEKELQKVTSDTFQKKEKNVRKVRNMRKDLARILTLINEKKIEILKIEKVDPKEKEKEAPKKKEVKVSKDKKDLSTQVEKKESLKEKKVIFEENLKSAEYRRKRKGQK